MAKTGENGVRETVAKMVGTLFGKNWLEVTMAKTGETGVRETVAKMGGTRCGKNG